MMLHIEDALNELDRIDRWRGLLLLSSNAAAAVDAVVEALPWVTNGVPRGNTVAHVFRERGCLMLMLGGALTSEEGTHLFSVREQLKGATIRIFIVPPFDASPEIVAKVHSSGVVPRLVQSEKLPNVDTWKFLSIFLPVTLVISFFLPRGLGGLIGTLVFYLLVISVLMYFVQKWRLRRILSDPTRKVIARWACKVPVL